MSFRTCDVTVKLYFYFWSSLKPTVSRRKAYVVKRLSSLEMDSAPGVRILDKLFNLFIYSFFIGYIYSRLVAARSAQKKMIKSVCCLFRYARFIVSVYQISWCSSYTRSLFFRRLLWKGSNNKLSYSDSVLCSSLFTNVRLSRGLTILLFLV